MPHLLAPQPYKIAITRFFPVLRKIHGAHDQLFGMCASINDKNCNYKPCKSFITQNHLLILWKKHRETFVTQGKHREFYLGWNVATLVRDTWDLYKSKKENCNKVANKVSIWSLVL